MPEHEYYQNLNTINDYLGQSEILAQMAEEAAEVAQACLKLRRAIDQKNVTPTSLPEAVDQLEEEWADLLLCKDALLDDYKPKPEHVQCCMEWKAERWRNRLLGTDSPAIGDEIFMPDGNKAIAVFVNTDSVFAIDGERFWQLSKDSVIKTGNTYDEIKMATKRLRMTSEA